MRWAQGASDTQEGGAKQILQHSWDPQEIDKYHHNNGLFIATIS